MPTYLAAVNAAIAAEAARHPDLVQFGENIAQGSRICGIARNLAGRVVNVGNCENTHVGAGLGMMLNGGRSVLFVKQLDFLLLAADQMGNTMNLVRAMQGEECRGPGSFTIVTIVCDQGWQGPQSSLNDLAGLCSLVRWDGFALTSEEQARRIVETQLVAPGARILALSQRLFPTPVSTVPVLGSWDGGALMKHTEGAGPVIVCLGFTLDRALALGGDATIFAAQPAMPHDWSPVAAAAARSRRLIVLDEAKGAVSLAHKIVLQVLRAVPGCYVTTVTREQLPQQSVNADLFEPAEALAC